jgi:hypothetical protein
VLCCALNGPLHRCHLPLGPKQTTTAKEIFLMAAHDLRRRMGAHLFIMLALFIPCLMVGCGGVDGSKPAPVDAAQAKKAQQYMANYREQLIAESKKQAQAKAKAAEKNSP